MDVGSMFDDWMQVPMRKTVYVDALSGKLGFVGGVAEGEGDRLFEGVCDTTPMVIRGSGYRILTPQALAKMWHIFSHTAIVPNSRPVRISQASLRSLERIATMEVLSTLEAVSMPMQPEKVRFTHVSADGDVESKLVSEKAVAYQAEASAVFDYVDEINLEIDRYLQKPVPTAEL